MSSMTATGSGTRRQNWHYPQPPSTRILHLPRRSARRKAPRSGRPSYGDSRSDRNGNDTNLEALFDRERVFSKGGDSEGGGGSVPVVLFENYDEREMRRREGCEGGGSSVDEEKWRFQAEVLRAECNLLRMEKEIAVRKLGRSRVYSEQTLRSAIEALISGRKRIREGKNVATVLDEEIQNLVDKLKELGKSSRAKYAVGARSSSNFDQQVTILRRRLHKLGGLSEEKCVEKIPRIAVESLSMTTSSGVEVEGNNLVADGDLVEILRRKMEGLSKHVLLERMEEEYDSILSAAADSSISGSTSASKPVQCLGNYVPFIRHASQEISGRREGTTCCSGHCKAAVRRIVEQVRADTEQWSQLQEMLVQVRDEMAELQASRDFWEDRAVKSDTQYQSLHSTVQEWRQRALLSETKEKELRLKVSTLRDEIDSLKKDLHPQSMLAGNPLPLVPSSLNETEERFLTCSRKENHHSGVDRRRKVHSRTATSSSSSRVLDSKRSPLRDIGNSSGQNAKLIFPLSCRLSNSN